MTSNQNPSMEPGDGVPALHERAVEDLRFIRDTMAKAASFTTVPGWGVACIGLTALAVAAMNHAACPSSVWVPLWIAEALIALAIGGWAVIRKARFTNTALLSAVGRKFLLNLLPPLAVGGLLTPVLMLRGAESLLPGVWLLLYGAGAVTAGAFSVPTVPTMGVCFMILGTTALVASPSWHVALLASGFGLVHLVFGVVIARRHGG
jgi:hypothetical protein